MEMYPRQTDTSMRAAFRFAQERMEKKTRRRPIVRFFSGDKHLNKGRFHRANFLALRKKKCLPTKLQNELGEVCNVHIPKNAFARKFFIDRG